MILLECLGVILPPLIGAILAGLFGKQIGRVGAHSAAIGGVAISCLFSLILAKQMLIDGTFTWYEKTLYIWGVSGHLSFQVGILLDHLTILMMCVVTFVSLMVHIYTIGYMHDDPGYQRFFSYTALFTFAMLMLVMSNNFLQLFFGWEAVGLVSYLLIGFWFKKETAIFANMKAFIVNRVGDFGFILGIGGVLAVFGTLDYVPIFSKASEIANLQPTFEIFTGYAWSAFTVICILLFIGAMGKSAQVPLHVWLPDSMEGPTPISALIHAATMVTAGVFMVARMSPLFELSETALSVVTVIGAITCFFTGLLAITQNDIKRIIAYSTLSQLGYMVVALGVSAYAAGIFHLMTHAFFKALLFLGAGSVIIALHHEQDIRKMGGLWKVLPITYGTMFIGSLALIGFPGLAGFYSKDTIIEAVKVSQLPIAQYAYWAVLSGVFVTAFYSFRLVFLVFHGKSRVEEHDHHHAIHEPSAVVWLPLVLLAVPSMIAGALFIAPMYEGYFRGAIFVLGTHPVMARLGEEFHGPIEMLKHGFQSMPFILAIGGVFTAWLCYIALPKLPSYAVKLSGPIYPILKYKYGFDAFNQWVLAKLTRGIGTLFWQLGDKRFIDDLIINGSAKTIGASARIIRRIQSGYVYHYAFMMIFGILALMIWLVWGMK
ncbi:MAG: NADH-quinone oxidoreductase subunit L [Gammaproteobacteria bacterium]